MSTFGELIESGDVVFFAFYAHWHEDAEELQEVLANMAAVINDKARLIKIDADKNQVLLSALNVKQLPTYMIYKSGAMCWRHSGWQDENFLIDRVMQWVNAVGKG